MKSEDIVPYVDSAKLRVGNSIMEDAEQEQGEITTIPGTIQLNGLILDASDPALFKALRREIRLESEEGRNTVFTNIRDRVVEWIELIKQISGQELVDEILARRIWSARDVIQNSLIYTSEASRYLETFTDLDKNGKPLYDEQNMQTMNAAAKYLSAYLSKVDVSSIDEIRLEILRNLKKDPNRALCISDGRIFGIPTAPDSRSVIHSVGEKNPTEEIIAQGKEVVEKLGKGTEIITHSDVYILKAYLKYFENYAEGQRSDIADFRTYTERVSSKDDRNEIKRLTEEYLSGKSDNYEFAYNLYVASGKDLQKLREVTAGFDADKRRGVYHEAHTDFETALEITEQRMGMNLKNTDPIYKNTPPEIAARVITGKSAQFKHLSKTSKVG